MNIPTFSMPAGVLSLNHMHDEPLIEEFPDTLHFATKAEFDEAVGKDFIQHANRTSAKGQRFLVGLSHGQSPAGPYRYILDHYDQLKYPDQVRFTFVHSRLKRQRDLKSVMDAREFLRELRKRGLITNENILGTTLDRRSIEDYAEDMEAKLGAYLKKHGKQGMDYVFLASDSSGRVGAISRSSKAFEVERIGMVVHDRKEKELTITPWFLMKSKRIAFLATKSDKRRALAWLYCRWGMHNESPSFLRYMPEVHDRMVVFIDDRALTWPQVAIERETPYGNSTIKIDFANPFREKRIDKKPVILLIHGFLGLNTFDGLLTSISSHKYIAAAMHYGTVPDELPPAEYSNHVMHNIDAVVQYFGEKGHPVYIFDHSMGNIYFLMMDKNYENLPGIRNYLKGRIGANPFFGEEAQHATLGFMDNVLIPSDQNVIEKTVFMAARAVIPFDSAKNQRRIGIYLTEWLIKQDLERVWKPLKKRIFSLMTGLGSLPHLNRVPISRALNRIPPKLFVIQVHSALIKSTIFDEQHGIRMTQQFGIPVKILMSSQDPVAKFVPRVYKNCGVEVIDIANPKETEFFREHLYHMIHPKTTTRIIDEFITDAEATHKAKITSSKAAKSSRTKAKQP